MADRDSFTSRQSQMFDQCCRQSTRTPPVHSLRSTACAQLDLYVHSARTYLTSTLTSQRYDRPSHNTYHAKLSPSVQIERKMHPCLQVAEIQEQICSLLSQRTSSRLARTCRSFYEPAMDRTWEILAGYTPLIKCMPSDLWTEEVGPFQEFDLYVMVSLSFSKIAPAELLTSFAYKTFTRDPPASEWQNFRKHAHRVKLFEEQAYYGVHRTIDGDTMDVVSRHICQYAPEHSGFPLFPTLVLLHVAHQRQLMGTTTELVFNSLAFMAGPTLIELHLLPTSSYFWAWNECKELRPVHGQLLSFASSHHTLQYVALHSKTDIITSTGILALLPNLVEVDVDAFLNELTLLHLSKCTGRRKLDLSWTSRWDLDHRLPTSTDLRFSRPAFRSLAELSLDCVIQGVMLAFLKSMEGSTTLRLVRLILDDEGITEYFSSALVAISRIPGLEDLNVSFYRPGYEGPIVLTSTLFAELRKSRRLRTLKMDQVGSVRIADDDLFELGLACPLLETISIAQLIHPWGPDHAGYDETMVTLAGLAAMRRVCPRLEFVGMVINDTLGPMVSRSVPHNVQILRPVDLRIYEGSSSPALDTATVAMIMRILFPKLRSFYAQWCWPDVGGSILWQTQGKNCGWDDGSSEAIWDEEEVDV